MGRNDPVNVRANRQVWVDAQQAQRIAELEAVNKALRDDLDELGLADLDEYRERFLLAEAVCRAAAAYQVAADEDITHLSMWQQRLRLEEKERLMQATFAALAAWQEAQP